MKLETKSDSPHVNIIYIEMRPEPDKLSELELDLDIVSEIELEETFE